MEKFKGNIPNIDISYDHGFFAYYCKDTDQFSSARSLRSSCAYKTVLIDKCFDCLAFNKKFAKFSWNVRKCKCGRSVDFGYFMIIYLLERAELLPKDFKMECCICKRVDKMIERMG